MAMQQLEQVRAMKSRRPFVPFCIVTTAGDRLLIDDRFGFAVGMTRMSCTDAKTGADVELVADKIAGVEVVEQKAA